ncbi:hypothetical protein GALMADRAFT_1125900 [Galerina marginata CBS 339.88]|uniref:Mid2 domain-containing protein n=1 Tax=Galerina marginata (strain CBS 339.88) TaxID=685588 RepID=A0A067TDU2_GALM3|nr:hypothetical protein GALMADRAFT_1125900 [Galerina marginata CBS 339.88]
MSPLYHSKLILVLISLGCLCEARLTTRRRTSSVGVIIGCVIGALAAVILVACLFIFLLKRRRRGRTAGVPQLNQFGGSNAEKGNGINGPQPTTAGNPTNYDNRGQIPLNAPTF